MSNPFDVFKDDNFDAASTGEIAPKVSVAQAKAGEEFVSICPKCRGTGNFISYSGRSLGPCFSCKGKGKHSHKTSPEARAAGRERAAVTRTARAQDIAADAHAWLKANPAEAKWLTEASERNASRGGTFTFPGDILSKLYQYGSLTEAQVAAVRKLAAKDAERSAARVAAAPEINVTKIEQAFEVAREKSKRPGQDGTFVKPLKLTHGEVTVHFTPGTPGSTWDGMLFAKTPDGKKLGHVKAGKFFAKFDCSEIEEAAVQACASDPQTAVVAYAKAWKACGICSRTLLNDVSIARGIGPICAEKYGWSF